MHSSAALSANALSRFVHSEEPGALLITGDWGVGKTHLWQTLHRQLIEDGTAPATSYVSLFGAASIEEIKARILLSFRASSSSLRWIPAGGRVDRLKDLGAKALLNYSPNLAAAVAAGAMEVLPAGLVVLDDLERCSSSLKVAEVLGVVDSLAHANARRVILICNDEMLYREDFDTWREKVFDFEVRLVRTSEEASAIGVAHDSFASAALRESLTRLGCTNIRVARKASRLMTYLQEKLEHLPKELVDEIANHSALFTWAVLGMRPVMRAEELRAELRGANWLTRAVRSVGDGGESDESGSLASWNAALRASLWTQAPYDDSLVDYLQFGYIDPEKITAAVGNAAQLLDQSLAERQHVAIWDTLYLDLNRDEADFVDQLGLFIRDNHCRLRYRTIDSSLATLEDLGYDIGPLIDRIVQENPEGLVAFAQDCDWNHTYCEKLREVAILAAKRAHKLLTLGDAINLIYRTQELDHNALSVIAAAELEDLKNWLAGTPGDNARVLKNSLGFVAKIGNPSETMKSIAKLYDDLRDWLATRSQFDSYRARVMLGRRQQIENNDAN